MDSAIMRHDRSRVSKPVSSPCSARGQVMAKRTLPLWMLALAVCARCTPASQRPDAGVMVLDGGGTAADGGGTEAGPPPDASVVPWPCEADGGSTLSGVSIVLAPSVCSFTLEQALAGISVPYSIVVQEALHGVQPLPQDIGWCARFRSPNPLLPFETLEGGGQYYGLFDLGNCGPHWSILPEIDVEQGTYNLHFDWDGQNWHGPSDVVPSPRGPLFPPGNYRLTVSLKGWVDGGSYDVWASVPITVLP